MSKFKLLLFRFLSLNSQRLIIRPLHHRSNRMKVLALEYVPQQIRAVSDGSAPPIAILMAGGLFGLLWKQEEEEQGNATRVPLLVKKSIFKAEKAMIAMDYVEAEQHLHKALLLLDTSEHAAAQPYIEAKAVVLDKLGNMYLECGQWEKAASSLVVVISLLRISGVEEESCSVVELSLKIAKAYANLKWFDKARLGFEWSIATALTILDRERTEESYALLGMCYQSKGQFHLMAKEPKKSYENYMQAIECAKTVYGTHHSRVAVLMNDLASALDMMGESSKAESVIHKAVAIVQEDEEKSESYYENMAVFLINLAVIQKNQGHTSEAISTYKSSYQYASKISNKLLIAEINKSISVLMKQ